MARLYANENYRKLTVAALRELGHDVETTPEAGNSGIEDADVIDYCQTAERAVLTYNRMHYIRLHTTTSDHAGIIICSEDHDDQSAAQRIHQAILANEPLSGKLLRITKAPPSKKKKKGQ